MAKSTGLVFSSRNYKGSAQPPATVLEDDSRFGYDGTFLSAGNPDWVQLPSGLWVMSFDGSDYVLTPAVASAPNLNLTGDMTLECWVYVTSFPELANLIGNSRSSQYGFRSALATNGTAGYYETNQAAAVQTTIATFGSSVLNRWVHFVATRSGAGALIYENGVDRTSTPASHIDPVASVAPVTLGSYAYSPTAQFLNGRMTPPRIYNRALSAGKIKQIFEAERHWFGV